MKLPRTYAKNLVVNRSASGFPTKRDSNQYSRLQGLARKLKFRSEQIYRYTFQLANDNDPDQSARIRFHKLQRQVFLCQGQYHVCSILLNSAMSHPTLDHQGALRTQ